MKNKCRLLIIILFVIFLTGCKANYNIKIYLDGQIDETLIIQLTKDEIADENSSEEISKEKFEKRVKGTLDTAGVLEEINDYSINYDKDVVKIKITASYDNIEEYVNQSKAIHYLFEDLEVTPGFGKTKLVSINGDFFANNKLSYEESIISISLPYSVTNTNASSHDEDTNTYTWVIDEYFEGIEFEYSEGKIYSGNFFQILSYAKPITYFNLAIFVIVTSLLILIVYLGIKLFVKEKHD